MLDDFRMAQTTIGAPHGGRHVGIKIRQPLYMGFVNNGRTPAMARKAVVSPCISGVVDDAFGHHWCAVTAVHREIAANSAQTVAEQRVVPDDTALEPARVWIDEQLIRIETVPIIWSVGAMHAIAVELAWLHALEIAMPNLVGSQRQANAVRFMPPVGLEQAEVDGARMCRKQREVDAVPVPRRAERRGPAIVKTDHRGGFRALSVAR